MRARISTLATMVETWKQEIYNTEMIDQHFDAALFRQSLKETIAWCKPRVDVTNPVNSLRSPELYPDGWPADDYSMSPEEARPAIDKRHALINLDAGQIHPMTDLEGGRLLVFFPGNCLYEGAVALATWGFIGDYEEPPWDTWVYYGIDASPKNLGEYLISWIPPQFVEIVNDSFNVMTIEWLWWIDEVDLAAN
jgi:hypothetical protein